MPIPGHDGTRVPIAPRWTRSVDWLCEQGLLGSEDDG